MANTMVLLGSATVSGTSTYSVTFNNISQGYNDLKIVMSQKTDRPTVYQGQVIYFNNSYAGSTTVLQSDGSATVTSNTTAATVIQNQQGNDSTTTNIFGMAEIYVANYAQDGIYKSAYSQSVSEANATNVYNTINQMDISGTSKPITSIKIESGNVSYALLAGSQYYLYGIFNKDVSAVPGTAPTIGTATAVGPTNATVAFTTVSNAASYTATSSPGGITATGTKSPILVTGLNATTAYTFTVKANNPFGSSASSSASNSITTGANAFVQAWETGPMVTISGDGINWFAQPIDTATSGQGTTKMGSTYAIARSGTTTQPVTTTTDFVTFTPRTIGGTSYAYLFKLATNGSIFLAGGGAGGYNSAPVLKSTTDFVTWTDRTSALTYNIYSLSYNNGYFLAADGNGNYSYSTNGTSFTGASAQWSPGGVPNVGLYFNGRWLFAGNGGEIRYSTSINPGSNWTNATGQNGVQIQGGWQNGTTILFCHNDGNVSRSTNGTSYTYSATGHSGGAFLSVTYGAGLWVLAARSGVIFTSPDTTTWTQRTSGVAAAQGGSFGGYYG